ncbi:hypothetical protein L5515_009149 [Caenorhabditis briggsae]|uniref:F-box domain-containing protein n=1 Tax=Caenorhabditis briggsae TaxID=6238 RepID=A0AAE9F2W1_CAEBR|nr:hypothetical protein L5515_009149 [Caenorhabditis briggsae]
MSLTDIPDLAITTILEKLDFRSLLNLRNVCHGSRKHIENTISPFWISRIEITVATDKIDLHLEDDIIEMLKESLQESPNLQTFDLHFEPDHSSLVLRRMIRNVFQEAYVDETSLTNWYSRIPDSPEYILSARSSYFSWITFSRSKM